MIQFLEDLKGSGTPALTPEERAELDKLRKDHAKLKAKVQAKQKDDSDESGNSSDEVSDQGFIALQGGDVVQDLPFNVEKQQ